MRDIFTMGARPIAALNSLRFGNLSHPHTKYLMKGIVKGIGDYGNSFGVPTVAGDVFFDDCYNENPLVNAMSIGIVKHSEIARAAATGEGNVVMIAGSSTGRDGIHGATFASEEISEESESRRPSVQVGDPFTEKLLLEATLEAIREGYIIGVQDMGAAGISCSTSEMSARGNSGMIIDLDKVPLRENNMTSYEIMLSESQERMLLVVSPQNEKYVKGIFEKWDLQCQAIGVVTPGRKLIVEKDGVVVVDIPAESLVLGGGAPVYYRESKEPEYIRIARKVDLDSLPEPQDYNECFLRVLSSPNICSKKWIYTQYDTMVRTNTVIYSNSDAAVVRIKDKDMALAMKTDCNPRYVYLNPYLGAQIAVAESARNVVCTGAKPLAITNCLNFGNPYKPEIFWQFKEAVRGIADACRALSTPVTGGNVSFYNESPDGPIYPTPVIGMIGEIQSLKHITSANFKNVGDVIVLLGTTKGHLGGSEYLKTVHNNVSGDAPPLDLEIEKKVQKVCLELVQSQLVNSAHDVSDGGLVVALAESCIINSEGEKSLGATIQLNDSIRYDKVLFGEDQSRIIISANESKISRIIKVAERNNVNCQVLGTVVSDRFTVNEVIDLDCERVREVYDSSLQRGIDQ